MKIVHICLANFYVDGMGYQENLLPKFHSKKHEVYIITSDYSFNSKGEKQKKEKKEYLNEHGIFVKVLERSSRFGKYSQFRDYDGLYDTLNDISPDVIFCHGGQFVALMDVIRYCKKNRSVNLFIDQHGDYYNMKVKTHKEKFVHYFIYGHWMRMASRYVSRFWGVTPWRCRFLHEVYGIDERKIGFLPMGGDDEKIDFNNQHKIRRVIRSKHNISEDAVLVVTGGKIDNAKNIHLLMKAVSDINCDKINLLVFGQPHESVKGIIDAYSKSPHIRNIGWIPSDQVYDYFLASDLAVFPGTHSVLWEQACACGLPIVVRDWPGMHHIDMDGNAIFLHEDSAEEIERVLLDLYNTPNKLSRMKIAAMEKCVSMFSYRRIASQAIMEDEFK